MSNLADPNLADPTTMRLVKLRDRYLTELDKENPSRPNFTMDGETMQWAGWRLKMVQCIRELQATIRGE